MKTNILRAAAAIAAAAASPPLAAGQIDTPPSNPIPTAPGSETATGAGGAAAGPTAPAQTGTPGPEKTEPAKSAEPAVVKPEKPAPAAKAEGARSGEKAATGDKPEGAPPVRKRRERSASAATATATATEKPAEAAGEKKPAEAAAGAAKPDGETAKAETAKPAEGGEAKPAESAKPAEAPAAVTAVLKITSSPAGAEVVIDGVPVGSTPFSSKEIDPTGTHAITVKKDGFETHERMISGSDWSRGKGGAQSLKFNVKLRKTAGEQKPAEAGEKKEAKPEVEILTPSEP